MPVADNIIHLPPRCDHCRMTWRTLFDAFVNGLGWQRLCARCCNPPEDGGPRAYTGPYPITAIRRACLHAVGDAQG